MRQPTPRETLLAWWRLATIAGSYPDRHDGDPQAGYYRMRSVKNGPWVPVRISVRQIIDPDTGELTEPEVILADVAGVPADPVAIWTYCQPITQAAYAALIDACGRDAFMAATHAPINLAENPIGPSKRKSHV